MTKRYKIKQWFKKYFTKDKVFCIICTLLIGLLVLLCVYFENKDIEEQKQKHSDIIIEEDNINLNTSWTINTDGNLVGDNLLNIEDFERYFDGGSIICKNNIIVVNGTATSNISFTLTTITLSQGDYYIYDFYNSNPFVYVSESDLNYPRNAAFGLDTTRTINIGFWFSSGETADNITLTPMLVRGSTRPTDYEPYGVWYSDTNYILNGTLKYNEGLATYQKTYYYFDNKTCSVYYDNGQNDGNLVGDILLTQTSYSDYSINILNTLEQWLPDISRADAFRIDIPMNLKSSEVFINASWPTSTADGYFKVYYDDGTSYNVPQTTFISGLFVYDGSSTNSDKYVLKISYQIVYDVIDTIDITTSPSVIYYNNGYNEGYDIGFSSGVSTGQSNGFTNGYNNGYQIGYNEGATKDLTTNGFQTLCNSILSYPVNLISKVFNFEFMGINIASTIFFLISCGIVLWIIKRLWK